GADLHPDGRSGRAGRGAERAHGRHRDPGHPGPLRVRRGRRGHPGDRGDEADPAAVRGPAPRHAGGARRHLPGGLGRRCVMAAGEAPGPEPAGGTAGDDKAQVTRSELRTVLLSTVVGTTVEWYDFFLYGVAAGIIFNKLYFPSEDPVVGTLLAFATFAVGFLARPFGGVLFGHIGDRVGRKKTLVATMMIMGVATFLIGVLPTYESIGVAAPILLVVLRLAQGIAIGGEWGGAVLMSTEYAPPGRKGLFGSVPQIGLAVGLMLGTGVFSILNWGTSDEAFLAWGWRIAFGLSAVLVLVGLYIRLKVLETPAFRKLE